MDDTYSTLEWAVQWDDERGLEVMKLWKITNDDQARQIADGNPRVKAVLRRTVTIGPWVEVKP